MKINAAQRLLAAKQSEREKKEQQRIEDTLEEKGYEATTVSDADGSHIEVEAELAAVANVLRIIGYKAVVKSRLHNPEFVNHKMGHDMYIRVRNMGSSLYLTVSERYD